MIRTRDLTKQFDAVVAVDHLNVDVSKGEIFGLVGPDGAGKTTTLRLLAGLLNPTEGQAWISGFDVTKETDAVKDRIGYMAQRFGLYTDLTVQENMHFYADLFGITPRERDDLMVKLLQMTRMQPFRGRFAGQLSGGMKQKLALMCTLLHHPEVLLLDEPTNGVDPVSRRDFWAILYQLVRDGMTVFVSTAYLDEAERCNRVGLLHGGRMIECDAPQALKTKIKQVCFEVRTTDLRAARTVLQAAQGVLSVVPAGEVLHVFVAPDHRVPEGFERLLSEKGLGPATVRPIVPSLEDVFISLVQNREGRM